MIRLQNDDVSLTLEENGTLSELSNRKSGRILTLPHSLIRLIIGDPQCLELEAVPFGNPEIRKDGNTLYLHYPAIECEQRGRLEIGVELSIRLEGDEVQWGISLDNRTAEEVIREIHYPILTLRDPEPPGGGDHLGAGQRADFESPGTDPGALYQLHVAGSEVHPPPLRLSGALQFHELLPDRLGG